MQIILPVNFGWPTKKGVHPQGYSRQAIAGVGSRFVGWMRDFRQA
jgi:hypothetical protein